MFRRLRCQVVQKLGSTAGPRALGTKSGKSQNEAAMGSGRVIFFTVPNWVPPGGARLAPVAAALRSHLGGPLGGSWGRLGAPLAPLGTLLGLPEGTPGAPQRLPGELREAILRGIFKVGAGRPENHLF